MTHTQTQNYQAIATRHHHYHYPLQLINHSPRSPTASKKGCQDLRLSEVNMRYINVILVLIAIIPVQLFQNYTASVRRENLATALQLNGVEVCRQPIDDRASLERQRINIKESAIHGLGLFANASIACGSIIYDAYHMKPLRILENTPFEFSFWGITNVAARVNHHHIPSAQVKYHTETNTFVLIASRHIDDGEEITIDYLDRPYFAPPPYPQWDVVRDRNSNSNTEGDVCGNEDCVVDWRSIDMSERVLRLVVICVKWMIPVALLAV